MHTDVMYCAAKCSSSRINLYMLFYKLSTTNWWQYSWWNIENWAEQWFHLYSARVGPVVTFWSAGLGFESWWDETRRDESNVALFGNEWEFIEHIQDVGYHKINTKLHPVYYELIVPDISLILWCVWILFLMSYACSVFKFIKLMEGPDGLRSVKFNWRLKVAYFTEVEFVFDNV